MPFVDATGTKLNSEEMGFGYPIIFAHELLSDCRGWKAQIDFLSCRYRCIAFNARGYPPSDVPTDPGSYSWNAAVDDIAAVMQCLGIERAHLVELSMGAYAVLQFGVRYPEKVGAIVAAGVGSGSPPGEQSAWRKETALLARAFIGRGMDAMARKMAHSSTRIQLKYKDASRWQDFVDRLRQHSAAGMSHTVARCLALRPSLHSSVDQLSEMILPVLLAVGADDTSCLETSLMLKSTLPNASLWICADAGHAINLEEPVAFNTHIESFLASVEEGSRCCGARSVAQPEHLRWHQGSAPSRCAQADQSG